MHPATTTAPTFPAFLSSSISRMTASDSCRAGSMNPQVLTTTTSAPSASGVRAYPSWASLPSILSVSTVFFGQPRLTQAYRPLVVLVMSFSIVELIWGEARGRGDNESTDLFG